MCIRDSAKTVSDAEKEAEYFLSLISGKSFEFPVAFDIEDLSLIHI